MFWKREAILYLFCFLHDFIKTFLLVVKSSWNFLFSGGLTFYCKMSDPMFKKLKCTPVLNWGGVPVRLWLFEGSGIFNMKLTVHAYLTVWMERCLVENLVFGHSSFIYDVRWTRKRGAWSTTDLREAWVYMCHPKYET